MPSRTTDVPARLHVLLARNAPSGLVIRRGPSRQVALIGWDRDQDTFALGQWLRGRIYERRCDLSPDGRHFIYFAMNGRWNSSVKGSWTAISRAPYLKAVTLYAKGDCWNGGGLFKTNERYWLNDGLFPHTLQWQGDGLHRAAEKAESRRLGECTDVYYQRLARDGWTAGEAAPDGSGGVVLPFHRIVSERWLLRKYAHATLARRVGRGCYFDTHELVDRRNDQVLSRDDWEWADVDRGRLVWAAQGVLGTTSIGRDERLGADRVLHDFNAMTFENRIAPY